MHVRIHFFCPEQLFFMCTVFLILVNLSIIIKEEHSLACYMLIQITEISPLQSSPIFSNPLLQSHL